ncbi:MAG: sigma-E factor negative regulatory protein [Gallionellaceae bacterium]|jgi:sigma-E factor negative regulatory protein RseA|nr:sigma-E factor negative regulatory protein [Gallionellaceae bacterium]
MVMMMRQHISALADGELFDDEAETVLDQLKRNPEGNAEWEIYHLIGDVLRQPDHIRIGASDALYQRLQAEPTILAPQRKTKQNARWFALSAAASVAAMAMVGWFSTQIGQEPQTEFALAQPPSVAATASSSQASARMNEYLLAHQEFSPSASMQGPAPYIHTVADQQ